MKPCPFCGVLLTAALVASIVDPKQEESCPSMPLPLSTDGVEDAELAAAVHRLHALVGALS